MANLAARRCMERCQMYLRCGNVGGTELQADLTMGNLVSALTIQPDEAALIAELQAGSEEAFTWLISRYHQSIYSLLARTSHDRGAGGSGTSNRRSRSSRR